MALSYSIDWDVKTSGNNLNGGGFNRLSSGTDYSLRTTPIFAIDGTTVTASLQTTTQIGVVGSSVSSGLIGNILFNFGGTATTGTYEITAVNTTTNRLTVDRTIGSSGQTVIGNIGGCKADAGSLNPYLVTGNVIHIQSGTYTLTTSTPGSGGPIKGLFNIGLLYVGYGTNHFDELARPIISAGSLTGITIIDQGSAGNTDGGMKIKFLTVNGNSGNQNQGILANSTYQMQVDKCLIFNCDKGITYGEIGTSYISGCNVGILNAEVKNSRIDACVTGTNNSSLESCLLVNCPIGIYSSTATKMRASNNTIYNSSTGVRIISYGGINLNNTLIANCTVGISTDNATRLYTLTPINLYMYNVSTPLQTAVLAVGSYTTLTADPFQDSANGDFSPNNTVNGGNSLRNKMGVYSQITNDDVGGIHHRELGGANFYVNG